MSEDKNQERKIQVGGQAVIEGVMMRSRDIYSVAVRRPDGSIFVRKRTFASFVKRWKPLSMPVFRGAVVLIESLVLGVSALTFSGDVAVDDNKKNGNGVSMPQKRGLLENLWLIVTVVFSFAIGLLIFFYLPLVLTDLLGAEGGIWFNLVDGLLRLMMFLLYLGAITLMKDIRRIFEYHGAEHKSIFALEKNAPLTPAGAMPQSRFHPRCGTSFLLIVMLVSIVVFMFLGKPDTIPERLLRLAFIPLIGGISYELIRLSDIGFSKSFWKPLILPGLWLQRLTTKEPDTNQLEVAMVALKCALDQDVSDIPGIVFEQEIEKEQKSVKEVA